MTVANVTAVFLTSPLPPARREGRGAAPAAERIGPPAEAAEEPAAPSLHSSAVIYLPDTPARLVPSTYTIPGLACPPAHSAYPMIPSADGSTMPTAQDRARHAYATVVGTD